MDWLVMPTHGNEYQSGFPDLYCAHFLYGQKWIEIKNPDGFSFTPAQLEMFPLLNSKNVGVWILMSAESHELQKIHGPQNWYHYLSILHSSKKLVQ